MKLKLHQKIAEASKISTKYLKDMEEIRNFELCIEKFSKLSETAKLKILKKAIFYNKGLTINEWSIVETVLQKLLNIKRENI